jgi:radical SAM superfamily enzyme YgiQ (UPF0313 family)
MLMKSLFKPNLITVVPPYAVWGPPAGAAALLAYLKAFGCRDFSFIDLRLFAPDVTNPTYRVIGAFGESFVLDIPDLPLVLSLLEQFRRDEDLLDLPDGIVEPYCLERGLNSLHVTSYLRRIGNLIETVFCRIPDIQFIGFSVWTSNYLTTLLAASLLKRRPRPPFIVAGGPQVSQSLASARLGLRAGVFDAIAVGEGEQTLLDLYTHYTSSTRSVQIPVAGTITLDAETREFRTTDRPLMALKDLPVPDFDEMHLPAYQIDGQRVVSYQLSRGCTDKCSFCSEWVFWRHFRTSTMDKAVNDVIELKVRWGAERIWFTDSLLNGHMNKLREFAEGLLSKEVNINWNGYMRAQVDLPTAQLLRRAGCISVFVGVESLANETLDIMNKRMTEDQNLSAVQAFLEAGIRVRAGLIPGFPGDSRERFMRTAKVLRKMQATYGRLAVSHEAFVVLPGQPIFDNLERYGLRSVPWPDDVLGIAPHLSDIASHIRCRVEGDNQGLDRWGEYIISLSLTGPAQPADDPFSGLREAITPYEFTMSGLGKDVWLGRTLSPQGHIVGLILTAEEYAWFMANRASEIHTTPLCERREVAATLETIQDKHLISVSPSAPVVRPTMYRSLESPVPPSVHFGLGPFTVVRGLGTNLWLGNLATGGSGCVPNSEANAAAIKSGRGLETLEGAIGLVNLGLLVYTELPQDSYLEMIAGNVASR